MEVNLFSESIKKLVEKQKELKKLFIKTGIILLISSILLETIILFIFTKFNTELIIVFAFSIMFILFFDIIFMAIFCERRKTKFYYSDLNKLIVDVLRSETDFDLSIKNNQKDYISQLKLTRFQDGDFINLYGAFDFNNGDVRGTLFNVVFSRSNGKTSYTTLNGVVVLFNTNTNLDTQIRNDLYAPFKLKKVKEISNKDNRIYLPRKIEGKYSKLVLSCFNDLKKKYDTHSLGIDFNDKVGSFYLNYMNKMIKLKKIDKNNIVALCKLYSDCLSSAEEIKNKIEGNY